VIASDIERFIADGRTEAESDGAMANATPFNRKRNPAVRAEEAPPE